MHQRPTHFRRPAERSTNGTRLRVTRSPCPTRDSNSKLRSRRLCHHLWSPNPGRCKLGIMREPPSTTTNRPLRLKRSRSPGVLSPTTLSASLPSDKESTKTRPQISLVNNNMERGATAMVAKETYNLKLTDPSLVRAFKRTPACSGCHLTLDLKPQLISRMRLNMT